MKNILKLSVFVLFALAFSLPAYSDTVTFDNFAKFAGGAPLPVLTVTITDVAADMVEITMISNDTVDSNRITEWYFNIDPIPAIVVAGWQSGVVATDIQLGLDTYKADGDGSFDLLFTYPTSGSGVFDPGMTSDYYVTASGLNATDFYALSQPPTGGQGPFYTAVKESSWWAPTTSITSVPEPATMLLLGLGLMGLASVTRKIRK